MTLFWINGAGKVLRTSRFGPLLLAHRSIARSTLLSTTRPLHHLLRHPRTLSKLPPLPKGTVIYSTLPVTERKSVFVGHAVRACSTEEALLALEHILSKKKVAKASHNIIAYRFAGTSTVPADQGHHDGNEATAGRKLLHLLEQLGIEDVLIVVTRWHGGVQLGPDRFKLINGVAKQALDQAGLLKH